MSMLTYYIYDANNSRHKDVITYCGSRVHPPANRLRRYKNFTSHIWTKMKF